MFLKKPLSLLACAALLSACASHSDDSTTSAEAPAAKASMPSCCMSMQGAGAALPELDSFQALAERFDAQLTLPDFESTPAAIDATVDAAIARADAAYDALGALPEAELSFDNVVGKLDEIGFEVTLPAYRINLIKETSPDAALREAATEALKRFEAWSVGTDYREDVYQTVKAYADTEPELSGAHKKLFDEMLLGYERIGLHLPKEQRDEVEALRKELSVLETDFRSNITAVSHPLVFSEAELEGVPESFLSAAGIQTGEDEYTVMANITFHFLAVMENAQNPETRKRMKDARYSLAQEANAPLLQKIVELRDSLAHRLGYDSWADYRTELRMVKNADTALTFVKDLAEGLQPKFEEELEQFRQMKVRDTGDENAQIELADWRYYNNQFKKEGYAVDTEKLRVFFPLENVLEGMFNVYEHVFGIEVVEVQNPNPWADGVTLYAISDATSGEPMGLIYMDMFPREGKYNHFAQFTIIKGKRLDSGVYQRPTVALICNFPPPQPEQGKPSLLSHREVETLFHEYGHALHSVLTRADFASYSGTSVARDFVEAPSQMLENWCWDKAVLDSFAADYRDPSRKIDAEVLKQMEAAKLATIGTFYRRQLAFAQLDLALHSQVRTGQGPDVVTLSNQILSEVFLPVDEDSSFVTYFGHLMGYDAGYYGYAWSDAIAADMATEFEQADGGYMDAEVGMRLRNEIYAPGGAVDAEVLVENFLGRERSLEPFLKSLKLGGE